MNNKYPITFYNAIWLVLFSYTVLVNFSWWLFVALILFCPTWLHLREWYDIQKAVKKIKDNAGLILCIALFSSCTKEWNCTITTDTEIYGQTHHIVTHTTFHGTTAEKNDFEDTKTPNQTVECN